jgi:uncharacterized protein
MSNDSALPDRTAAPGTVFRSPNDPRLLSYPGLNPRQEDLDGMIIDRDEAVQLSDGVTIYVDIYKPESAKRDLPVLIGWSPYGKHKGVTLDMLPGHDVNPEHVSRHYYIETADPLYWCKHGYAVIFPDPRGTWSSEGQHTYFSHAESRDFYDLIEWAGTREWSNGKVGLIGQSYFAITQWKVAALNPPHLACIAPWGGHVDTMRNLAYHGGIPNNVMLTGMNMITGFSWQGKPEDWLESALSHPFDDLYWADKRTSGLEKITVPAYVVADWTDTFVHTPGTMDGYNRISSRQKWLEINGDKKWARMVVPEHLERLRTFYDTFLKGLDAGINKWPPVRVEVREQFKVGKMYDEKEWPLARTEYRRLYLHADGQAQFEPAKSSGAAKYEALTGRLNFDLKIKESMELTGFMKLRLWVEADGSDDMDLFVAVRKIDRSGKVVHFPFHTIHDNGEAAFGCLRVSHRTLDPAQSTDYRPVLTHDRELRLAQHEIVPVDIEIWPSGTLFQSGDTLQILVQGRDIPHNDFTKPGVPGHTLLRNKGHHVLHLGGKYDSYLLVPVIPKR